MKKTIIILLLLPFMISWNWNTHTELVNSVYYSLPFELQEKLDLSLMQQGAIAPDKDFHDNVNHHYPPSYELSLTWLDKTKLALEKNNYTEASYSFGVATHYIDDSFVAPHYIKKEPWQLHSLFEKQAYHKLTTKCINYTYELNSSLYEASKNKDDWQLWLQNQNEKIPQKEVEDALKLLYSVALETFNTSCLEGKTSFSKELFIPINAIIFLIILFPIIMIYKIKFS